MSSRCLRTLLLVLPLLAIACGDDSNGGVPPQLTPPTVREVQPTGGPIAGNTLVNVYGSGFQDGAKVFLGNLELQRTVVVNAFRIYGYTPTATAGRMDVRVLNPDGAFGVLVKGFTFEGPPAPYIAQAEVITGNSEAVSRGPPVGVTVRGAVTVPGVTRGVGQGGGVRAQVGFASGDSDVLNAESYTWEDATYETDSGSGEADVYKGNVLLQAPIGGENREWVVAVRFSIDAGKTWVMADGDGSANGLSAAMVRRVFIARPRVDYCKLGPDGNSANPDLFYLPADAASHKVAGQVYAADITAGQGGGAGLKAQLGYGPENSDPRDSSAWTWVDATYKAEHGNNDEWEATLPNPGAVGTYRVAFRFSISENAWRVCDADGTNDSTTGNLTFSLAKLGRLVVAATPPKPPVSWCKIGEDQTAPPAVSYITTQTQGLQTIFAQVHMPGVTDKPGAGVGITGQVGWGPAGEDPRDSTAWSWSGQLEFNKDNFTVNDEWKGTLTNPGVAGAYRYAVRFSVDGGPVRVCDGNGTDDGGQDFEPEQLGQLTVTGPPVPPTVVGYCKLGPDGTSTPETVTYSATGTANRKVAAQVFVLGATPGPGMGANIVGQLGMGPAGVDPTSNQWSWTTTAAYKGDIFNNDEYDVTLPNPGQLGTYRFAYRFQVNGGAFLYCDADGNDGTQGGFDPAKTGTLIVSEPPTTIGYCKLGPDGNTTPETVTYTPAGPAERKVVAQVLVAGLTPGQGAGAGVVAQLGYGPVGVNPEGSLQWRWQAEGVFKGDIGDNDEYEATLPRPDTLGTYRFTFRFRVNNGAFLYCDADGNTGASGGFDAAKMGTLTLREPPTVVGYCKLGPDGNTTPEAVAYAPGATADRKVVAQVYVDGATAGAGAGQGVEGQLGVGPAGTDPTTAGGWSWGDATYKGEVGDNDEFDATLPNPGVAGTYRFAYRFRVNGGAVLYCDADGATRLSEFDANRTGTLTVGEVGSSILQSTVTNTNTEVVSNGEPVTVTVRGTVTVPGVTGSAGQGAGVRAQVGFAPGGSDVLNPQSYTWADATFEADAPGGEADLYRGNVSLLAPVGGETREWVITARFSTNNGQSWVMADGDGSANGVSADMLRRVFIARPRVDYCKLGPDGNSANPDLFYLPADAASHKVAGQVYAAGITPGAGAGAGLKAQLGYGPTDADPRDSSVWTWVDATYKAEHGNNDEWEATLPNPGAAGTYRVAFRFSISENAWRVCDADGVNNSGTGDLGFSLAKLGRLVVGAEQPRPKVSWCKIGQDATAPEAITYAAAQTTDLKRVYAQVHMPGVTDRAGAGPGLTGQLGWGPADTDPQSSEAWNWSTQMTFNKDNFSVNDEWMATLPNPGTVGSYRYAVRFSANGGPVRVCDGNGTDDGNQQFELDQLGRLTVSSEPPVQQRVVGYCKLGPDGNNTPEAVMYATTGPADRKVVGQVFVAGVTPGTGAGAGVVAQLGWGPAGENPSSPAWNWTTAGTYKGEVGNNDEFETTLPNPGVAGTYRFAYRFQANGGAFLYCDANGAVDEASFDATMMGTLTVEGPPAPPAVCRLVSVSGTTVGSGDAVTAVGTVRVPGVTDGTGPVPVANLQVQVGVGEVDVDASVTPQAFTWKTATYSRVPEAGTHEYTTTMNPAYQGDREVSMRYSTDGATWTYCDLNGSDTGGYTPEQQHALTVNKHTDIDYCNLQWPFSMTVTGGADRRIFGQVSEEGITNQGGAGAGIVAEFGLGSVDSDPGVSGWTWVATMYMSDEGNNDQYVHELAENVPAGTAYMYRYSLNGGPYCYGDRNNAGGNGRYGDGFSKNLGQVAP